MLDKDHLDAIITKLSHGAPAHLRFTSMQQLSRVSMEERLLWGQHATQSPRIQELFFNSDTDAGDSPETSHAVEAVRRALQENTLGTGPSALTTAEAVAALDALRTPLEPAQPVAPIQVEAFAA